MGEYAVPTDGLDASGLRIAVAVGRFNLPITEPLLDGARRVLASHGVSDPTVVWVPGAFELPLAARRLAGSHDAVVALGAVIRGDTPHFDFVAGETAAGLMRVGLDTGIPVVFGVLTTDTLAQAEARIGGAAGHKGEESAFTAIEMAALLAQLPPSTD
ncbi:MAG: 6,7-dimethyl-8-ribityllumazine synthase [Acidimicrobiia bacterium]